MAQTLSAPAVISQIYKKLVFYDRTDGNNYLMDTNDITLQDTQIENIDNSFTIKGITTFSGNIKGDNFTTQKNIDDILASLYNSDLTPDYISLIWSGNIIDTAFQTLVVEAKGSLPETLLLEMNERYSTDQQLLEYTQDIASHLGFDFVANDGDGDGGYTWNEPAWSRLDLDTADLSSTVTVETVHQALSQADIKLHSDLSWLRGLQLKLDEGLSKDSDDFYASYSSSGNTNLNTYSNYLAGDNLSFPALDSKPTSFIRSLVLLDRRLYAREKEIDALDVRLNMSTTTNEDGSSGSTVWNGITFHGHEVTNSANEIDFEATETNLAGQVTDNSPNLGDAINKLIDRDERLAGLIGQNVDGVDDYLDQNNSLNMTELLQRITHIDNSLDNIRLHAFGDTSEAPYVAGNPLGTIPGAYNDLSGELAGGTYASVNDLEGNIIKLDEKMTAIENFLATTTTATGRPPFDTDVNVAGDGTNVTLELTINKMVDWFEQFCDISSPGVNQPKAIDSYTFDEDVTLDAGKDLLVQSDITLQRDNKTFAIKRASGTNRFTVSSQSGDTYIHGDITTGSGSSLTLGDYLIVGSAIAGDSLTVDGTAANSEQVRGTVLTATSMMSTVDAYFGGDIDADGNMDLLGTLDVHGDLDMNSNKILNVVTDQSDMNSVASVSYVGTVAAGRIWTDPVEVNVDSNINISNPGTATFDGETIATGEKILLTGQTNQYENGVWVFDTSSTALTRPATGDWQSGNDVARNFTHYVKKGSTHINTAQTITSPSTANFTIDDVTTGNLPYVVTDAIKEFVDGNVITQTGNYFMVNLGNGLTDDNGAGSWTSGPAHNLKIKLKGTSSLEFDAGNLEVAVDGTWLQKGAAGTGGAITLASSKQTEHVHSYSVTDSLDLTYWDNPTFINYIEGINQALTTTSDVDFNTVTATTFTGGLSGNATTSSGCTGNSATATALATPRDFSLTGFVTGTGTGFDGSGNLSINTSLAGSIADGNISSSGTWNATTNTVNTGSSDWDDAYAQRRQWDGGSTNLVASTARTNLGLGGAAVLDVGTGSGDVAQGNHDHDSDYLQVDPSNSSALQDIDSPIRINQNGPNFTEIKGPDVYGNEDEVGIKIIPEDASGEDTINYSHGVIWQDNTGRVHQDYRDGNQQGLELKTTFEDGGVGEYVAIKMGKGVENGGRNYINFRYHEEADANPFHQWMEMEYDTTIGARITSTSDHHFSGGKSAVFNGSISGSSVLWTGAIASDGTDDNKIVQAGSIIETIEGYVGSSGFTLETAEASMATAIDNKVPTVGAVVDYVQANSPATGVTSLSVGAGSGLSVDTSTGAVTLDLDLAGNTPGVYLNSEASDTTVASSNYTWSVGSNSDKQFQIISIADGYNCSINIDFDTADNAGEWKLLVKYDGDEGMAHINPDSGQGSTTFCLSLWGANLLQQGSLDRNFDNNGGADLIILQKFDSAHYVVSIVSPLRFTSVY